MEIVGAVLSTIGVLLTVWSLLYARRQSKLLSNERRDELISHWSHINRIRTLIYQTERITGKDGVIVERKNDSEKDQILSKIHKGLCEHYVRIAELIVKKDRTFSEKTIETLVTRNVLQTEWQKQQFLNLISALPKEVITESSNLGLLRANAQQKAQGDAVPRVELSD